MKASQDNPIYTVYVVSGGVKYNVTNALEAIDLGEPDRQIAGTATVDIADVEVSGKRLSTIIKVRDRVYIHANDGKQNDEVFRGYVWTLPWGLSLGSSPISIKCYDNLIYFQESEDSKYFSSGKKSKDIVSSLCKDWGVSVTYDYKSITHSKLALRGILSDLITSDILDKVKDQTGQKYVIRSIKDAIHIKTVGTNSTIYTLQAGKNLIEVKGTTTMDGMVTKVVILGKADDNDRQPVEATVKGNTSKYGTLQQLISRNENTSLSDAKKEAQGILDEKGKPYVEYEAKAVDIPWIHKGDKVKVIAGNMNGYYIVKDVARSIKNSGKTMTLTLEDTPNTSKASTSSGSSDKPTLNRILKLKTPRMTGDDIKWTQKRLNTLGYNCGTVDGIFGPKTDAAVKKFQGANNLVQDGDVGPLTWAKL